LPREPQCPLCRTPLELAIPGGVDGDILGFLARLRMAAHEMTTCHAQVLNEISSRFEQLASKSAAERRADSCIPVLARWKQQRAQQKQEHSIIQLRDKLDESALWALTNLQGLRKILKKFDKRTGMALRGEFLRQLVLKKSFVQDSLPGTGRCCQILHGVLELQRANTQPLAQPQMSVSMEQVFHDIERRYEQVSAELSVILAEVGEREEEGDTSEDSMIVSIIEEDGGLSLALEALHAGVEHRPHAGVDHGLCVQDLQA